MGYYTKYTLTWNDHDKNDDIDSFIAAAQAEGDYKFYAIASNGDSEEDAKWYNYEDDMDLLTRAFPDVLFILEGWGEEHGDIWRHYFFGNKNYREDARIQFSPYDPDALEEK